MKQFTRIVLASLCAFEVSFSTAQKRDVFLLAGQSIRFDAALRPQFTDNQVRNSADATRAGLARWAATEHGQMLIARFNQREYQVLITEDPSENGIGRAPQPAIGTLMAANDHSKVKSYDLILNPSYFKLPNRALPLPLGKPTTPGDMMAAAWAGEMLHIYFYSKGISLPHHQRSDFQEEWHSMAAELGFPNLRHEDGED